MSSDGGSEATGNQGIGPSYLSGLKIGLHGSLRMQLPSIYHPGSPQIQAPKATMRAVNTILELHVHLKVKKDPLEFWSINKAWDFSRSCMSEKFWKSFVLFTNIPSLVNL